MPERRKSRSKSKRSGSSSSVYDSVTIPTTSIRDPLATAQEIARASSKPSLIGARFERRTAKKDARSGINVTNNTYDAFGDSAAAIGRRANRQLSRIPGQYATDIGGLTPLLAGSGPVGENMAQAALAGNTFAATTGALRGVQSRSAAYNQSVQQQGEIERVNTIQSYQDDLQQRLAEIANYVRQVRAQEGATTATLATELASQKFQEELAAAQMELAKAQALGQEGLAAALQDIIAQMVNQGGGGNNNYAGQTGGGYGAAGNPVGINAAEQRAGVAGQGRAGAQQFSGNRVQTNNLETMSEVELGALLQAPSTSDFDKQQIIEILKRRIMERQSPVDAIRDWMQPVTGPLI